MSLTSNVSSLTTAETANLTALVVVSNNGNTGVTYSITGPGTLSGTGLARVLTPTGVGQIVVTATSVQDPTKSASVTIPVAIKIPTPVDPMVYPYGAPVELFLTVERDYMNVGGTQVATASHRNAPPDASAVFTITGPGTLSGAGRLRTVTATGVGQIVVTATSTQDPTKSASEIISVFPPYATGVTLATDRSNVIVGELANLTASVQGVGSVDPNVTYSITGPGTLSGTGLARVLTPTGVGQIVVTATSVADPTRSASRSISVLDASVCSNTSGTWEFSFGYPSLAPDPRRATRVVLSGNSDNPPVNGPLAGGLVVNVLLDGSTVLASSSPGTTAIWRFKRAASVPLGCSPGGLLSLYGNTSNWVGGGGGGGGTGGGGGGTGGGGGGTGGGGGGTGGGTPGPDSFPAQIRYWSIVVFSQSGPPSYYSVLGGDPEFVYSRFVVYPFGNGSFRTLVHEFYRPNNGGLSYSDGTGITLYPDDNYTATWIP